MNIRHFRLKAVRYTSQGDIAVDGVANNGGLTIAYKEHPDEPGKVVYSTSWCHPNDNFARGKGRAAAMGRMLAGKASVVDMPVHVFQEKLDGVQLGEPYSTNAYLALALEEDIGLPVPAAYRFLSDFNGEDQEWKYTQVTNE